MKTIKTILTCVAAAASLIIAPQTHAQLLYKVEKTGSDKTSYILGTHHFATLDVVDSIPAIPEILRNVDKLYGEIDMQVMQDPASIAQMQSQVMAPADSTLDKVFTPAQLDSIAKVVSDYAGQPVPIQMLSMVKPSVVSTQLGQLISAKVFPTLNPMENIDITMQTRARALGKPVEGLEDLQFQIDMLYNRPISEQAKGLMKSVRNPNKEEEMGLRLSNAYKSHDIAEILAIMTEEEEGNEETMDRMLYSRNTTWADRLIKELPAESLFIVVGAGHLPGDKGLLYKLQEAGYTVTPID